MEKEIIQSPILLVIFNRPDTTQKVFEAIRKYKPQKLFISADGARPGNENDKIKCAEAREIVKSIDWECDVKFRFLDENMGCGYGVSSAISWAFEHTDRLIILEDDCVPAQAFFPYCNYLLEKYKDDTRVWVICGRSIHYDAPIFKNYDYIFSHYGYSIGWATWKRCWMNYDAEMKKINDFFNYGGALNTYFSKEEGIFKNNFYKKIYQNDSLKKHVWDHYFSFSVMANGGLFILPAKNLIHNIGIRGTHSSRPTKYHEIPAHEDYEIKNEPPFVLANREYDYYHFKKHIKVIHGRKPYIFRLMTKLKRWIIRS